MLKDILRAKKGIAIILTVGILAVLTTIGIAFAVNMRLELLFAKNSAHSLKAKYLAEAGINKAITGLKTKAKTDFAWSITDAGSGDDDWYDGYSKSDLLSSRGKYSVIVTDCSSQIYVNGDNTGDRLEDMLNILGGNIGGGCSGDEGTKIINNRPTAGYETKKQLRIALAEGEYEAIKDYVTVHTYVNGFNHAPINVNTAKQAVLETVLEGISGISDGQAVAAANAIMNGSDKRPFSDWSGFDTCIDSALLTLGEKQFIKDNCNPNSNAWNSTDGAYEHSADTTEFCFHAGGYFEIESTGTFYQSAAQSIILARKDITSIVHTHSVFNKTTKADFTAGDTDFDGTEDIAGEGGVPTYKNVNWLDSCPVDSSDETGLYSDGAAGIYDVDASDKCKPLYNVIPGSIKLGFWDNCDEENDNTAQTGWSWEHWIDSGGGSLAIVDRDSDGDYELSSTSDRLESQLGLLGVQPDQWNCGQKFSIRLYAHVYEEKPHPYIIVGNDQKYRYGQIDEDVQHVEFIGTGGTSNMHKMYVTQFRTLDGWGAVPHAYIDSLFRMRWDGGGGDHYVYMNSLYGLTTNAASAPADGNRILPWNVAMRLVVDGSSTGNYTGYLAVDDGGAWHEWDEGGWVPWQWHLYFVKYDANDHNFHTMTDIGDTDRFDRIYHVQTLNKFIKTDWYLSLKNDVPDVFFSRYPIWDDIRIIPDEGYYQSPQYNPLGTSSVEWGVINWTLTMPASASSSSETAEVEVDTGTGSGFSSVSQNGSINATSSNIKYKVTLKSTDTTHEETPVFEDITVIYLPQTKTLYRSGQ